MSNPKISIVTPVHKMEGRDYFLKRLNASLLDQTFKNWEHVITEEGKMAENTNAGIKKAKGDIIKILFMDDFLYSPLALQNIAENFKGGWFASGCIHTRDGFFFENPHHPVFTSEVRWGKNTLGSPSVIAFENNDPLLFDENLSWLLDCELYGRLFDRYGEPTIVNDIDIAIGLGPHQTTHLMSNEEKWKEHEYITNL